MNPHLDAALSGQPWSLMGVINDFESFKDDEGRPLFERRAPLLAREGVPMVVKECPYKDERYKRSMNISALEQIVRYLPESEQDIASFRALLPEATPTWTEMCVVMMDQLAQSAIYALRERKRRGPIPARMAVGYKVAVGYSKPVRDLLELELLGKGREASVPALIDFVHEGGFFVGAREVCAGPTNMVVRVSEALLHGNQPGITAAEPARLAVARALTSQLQVAIAWRFFDRAVERRLLLEDLGVDQLLPLTPFLRRMLDERCAEYGAAGAASIPSGSLCPPLPRSLPSELRESIDRGVDRAGGDDPQESATAELVTGLIDEELGAIRLADSSLRAVFGRRFAGYLVGYRAFVEAQCALEREIRNALELDAQVPVKLDGAIFPKPRMLSWLEIILGYRLRAESPPLGGLTLRSLERTVSLP